MAAFKKSVSFLRDGLLVWSLMAPVCTVILKWQCLTTSRKNIRLVLDSDPAEMDTHLLHVFSDRHPIKMELVSKVSATILWLNLQDLGRQMTRAYVLFIRKVFFGSFYRSASFKW